MRASSLLRWAPGPLRIALKRWRRQRSRGAGASSGYAILGDEIPQDLARGFAAPEVAARQEAAFAPLLAALRAGRPREDFTALAAAVARAGLDRPRVVEVGCGGGWNAEVLHRLAGPVRYVGLDYSQAMLAGARRAYPGQSFVLGDALRLPFRDGSADILISGTVLMHLRDTASAIRESRRVALRWCVFHTVPVLRRRPTTFLRKRAYGSPTLEVIFNEGELRERLGANGLTVRATYPSVPYDLEDIVGEPTRSRTYLCEVDG